MENSHTLHEVPFHTKKIGVWCTVSCRRIVGRLFFEPTVDGTVHRDPVQQFVALLELDEHNCWFQKNSATSHTANETINVLRDTFGDHLISENIWPPCSPDLTIRYFLWGHFIERVHKHNPHTKLPQAGNFTCNKQYHSYNVETGVVEYT
ncbi:hypothetical protein Cfor_04553 [Coptotermes formosanus]|jgi:hypothetical protein|uniref:Tc1-like transposase DDE domain-containing protein n=1 Tax=Coptotermes formosanus TaxID=36987 RepID=A0A6L2PL07_COPFO|nr:hypothetical protein Cfor_04553 [Coptotermes formosanus]